MDSLISESKEESVMSRQTVSRLIRFLDAKQKGIVRLGIVPDATDHDVSTLVGKEVQLVDLVTETQPRQLHMSSTLLNATSTNHVTECKSIGFSQTTKYAEVKDLTTP